MSGSSIVIKRVVVISSSKLEPAFASTDSKLDLGASHDFSTTEARLLDIKKRSQDSVACLADVIFWLFEIGIGAPFLDLEARKTRAWEIRDNLQMLLPVTNKSKLSYCLQPKHLEIYYGPQSATAIYNWKGVISLDCSCTCNEHNFCPSQTRIPGRV